jgi:RNA polymerase sigma-70 factor, ECF subfamily
MQLRSNSEWLDALQSEGLGQEEALRDLRQGIFRAVQAYLGKQFVGRGALPTEEAHHLAEDCTQEALLAVLNNLTGFRGDSQFTTWVYAIAIRTVLADLRRRRWREVKREPERLGEQLPAWPVDEPSTTGPDRSLQQEEAWRLLARVIESELTLRQRSVLVAHVFDEMPLDEVAAWLGTNRDNVYKLLHDARKKLKRALLARGLSLVDFWKIFEVD